MAVSTVREQLRLAFSYRHKARALLEESTQALAADRITQSKHDALHAFYGQHLNRAHAVVSAIREREGRRLGELERAFRETMNNQARLSERVAAGKISPTKANDTNRKLTEHIRALTTDIECCRANLSAESAEDVGGHIDQSLDGYDVSAMEAEPSQPATSPGIDRVTWVVIGVTLVIAIILVFAVFPSRQLGQGSLGAPVLEFWDEGDGSAIIHLSVINTLSSPITLYVPWPGGTPTEAPKTERRSFGLTLLVIEEGADAYRLMSASPNCWFRNGLPLEPDAPVEFSPGSQADISLRTRKLKALGVSPVSLEVHVTDRDGDLLGRHAYALDDG